MPAASHTFANPSTQNEQLDFARQVLRAEAQAVLSLAEKLGDEFCRAADMLARRPGAIVVSGIGKAGLIGQKVAATLASLGTPSHFLHPVEAVHGDLGRVQKGDVLLVLSASGETEEIVRLLPILRDIGAPIVAITAHPASSLARAAAVTLDLGVTGEACSLGLAPSTSTTAMLALGDALALVVSRMRGFTAADFARLHPAGNLGRRLTKVEDAMRPLAECRVGRESRSVREVLVALGRPGRRTGAVMITDDAGRLTGLFTDSDLARLLERQQDAALDRPLRDVMTASPTTVQAGQRMDEAVRLLAHRKISELPVVDAAGAPLGLIDVTDVVGWLPQKHSEAPNSHSTTPSHLQQNAPLSTVSAPSQGPPRQRRRPPTEALGDGLDRPATLPFPTSNPTSNSGQQFHRLE